MRIGEEMGGAGVTNAGGTGTTTGGGGGAAETGRPRSDICLRHCCVTECTADIFFSSLLESNFGTGAALEDA